MFRNFLMAALLLTPTLTVSAAPGLENVSKEYRHEAYTELANHVWNGSQFIKSILAQDSKVMTGWNPITKWMHAQSAVTKALPPLIPSGEVNGMALVNCTTTARTLTSKALTAIVLHGNGYNQYVSMQGMSYSRGRVTNKIKADPSDPAGSTYTLKGDIEFSLPSPGNYPFSGFVKVTCGPYNELTATWTGTHWHITGQYTKEGSTAGSGLSLEPVNVTLSSGTRRYNFARHVQANDYILGTTSAKGTVEVAVTGQSSAPQKVLTPTGTLQMGTITKH